MTEIVRSRLQEPDCRMNGWVLDGYPKTIEQAKALREFKITPNHVIFLECPDAVVYERVENRRIDPSTGLYYNVVNMPDDENLRNRLVHLNEDTHEYVRKRLASYKEHVTRIHAEYSGISSSIKAEMEPKAICDLARDVIESAIPQEID
jgi:adenylate kinase